MLSTKLNSDYSLEDHIDSDTYMHSYITTDYGFISSKEMNSFVIQALVNLASHATSEKGETLRSRILSLYWAVFQGNVCVTAALIKGISKDYIPPQTRKALSALKQRCLELRRRSVDEIRIRHAEA